MTILAKLMPRGGESLVTLGSSFDGTGLPSSWSVGYLTLSDRSHQGSVDRAGAFLRSLGAHGRDVLSESIQSAFEADSLQRNRSDSGRLLHEQSNQIIGDEMHENFLLDHLRGFTTEHIHLQHGFEIAKGQFNLPALPIKSGQLQGRIFFGVQQRRHEDDFARAYFGASEGGFNNPDGQAFGHSLPVTGAHVSGFAAGLGPTDQPIAAAEFFDDMKTAGMSRGFRTSLMQSKYRIDPGLKQQTDLRVGAKAAVSQDDISAAKGSA